MRTENTRLKSRFGGFRITERLPIEAFERLHERFGLTVSVHDGKVTGIGKEFLNNVQNTH